MEKKSSYDKFLSAAIEQSSEGMAIAGLEGILMYANPAWSKMHGYDAAENLIGSPLSISHNQEQIEKCVTPFNRIVFEKGTNTGEVGHIRKDGPPFPTLMTTTLLKDDNGKPIAILGIAKDITEIKKAEEKLKKLNKCLGKQVDENTVELKSKTENQLRSDVLLTKKNLTLKEKSQELEETLTALKVLLKGREKDKSEIQENIMSGMESLIKPYLKKLMVTCSNSEQKKYLQIIDSNLKEIGTSLFRNSSSIYLFLTPIEGQIVNLIKNGKGTKEISQLMHVSEDTVSFHRKNIRHKLNLNKSKISLKNYLLTAESKLIHND